MQNGIISTEFNGTLFGKFDGILFLYHKTLQLKYVNLESTLIKLHLVECGIGLLLHGLGIFAIISSPKKTNQTLILFSLSVAETFMILGRVTGNIIGLLVSKGQHFNWNVHRILNIAEVIPRFQLVLVMHILTGDRLGSVISPFKYKIYMTRCRMKRVIFVSLVVAIICGVVDEEVFGDSMEYLLITIGILYIISIVVTYSFIISKIIKSRKQFSSTTTRHSHQQINFKKEYLVPTMIIVSFVLLYLVPYLFRTFFQIHSSRMRIIKGYSLNFIFFFGVIFDPVVYILMTKHYRDIIVKKCFLCRKQVAHAVTNDNIPLGHVSNVETLGSRAQRKTLPQEQARRKMDSTGCNETVLSEHIQVDIKDDPATITL